MDAGEGDFDGDGVIDPLDRCAGLDDRPDLNGNRVPDCAENLLANGQFATAAGWVSTSRATFDRSPIDALGLAGSGSGRVVNVVAQTTANGGDVDSSECVPVLPSKRYELFTQYFMPSGQPGGAAGKAVWIVVETYSDATCSTSHSAISGGTHGETKDAWSIYRKELVTDPTVHSIRVALGVLKGNTAQPVEALLDNVLLVAAYEPADGGFSVDPSRHYVFVTHDAWRGNLGGVAGADSKCAAAAAAARLPGTWRSILIGSGQTLAQRIPSGGPWFRVDGELAFLDTAEVLSAPRVPLFLDERGAAVTGYGDAWTGVIKYGGVAGSNCSGWTSSAAGGLGKAGRVSATSSDWIDQNGAGCPTSDCGPSCTTLLHLYCLQSP